MGSRAWRGGYGAGQHPSRDTRPPGPHLRLPTRGRLGGGGEPYQREEGIPSLCVRHAPSQASQRGAWRGLSLAPEVAGAPGPGRGTPGGGGHRVALGPQASRLPRAGGSKAELAVVLGFC